MTDEVKREPKSAGPNRSLRIVFGWLVGVIVGVFANYGLSRMFGEGYPVVPTTFVAIVVCAFAAMAITERLGTRAMPWIAAVTALALVVAAIVFVGPWLTAR
jgi:putative effector of murein hydrolase